MSPSAAAVTFRSSRYLDALFGGAGNGEMETANQYHRFVADVAARARARRLELGLETDDVARRVTELGHKLKGSSLENWERGDFPLKHVGLLAEALGMDWRELLGVVPVQVRPGPNDLLAEVSDAVADLVEGQVEILTRLAAISAALGLRAGDTTG